MSGNKTIATAASVDTYLASIADESRQQDCRTLIALMSKVTGEPPVMWGTSIVGFGSYHYRYESGREGDACQVGFSSRKGDISLYVMSGAPNHDDLLARLGKVKSAKACVYIKRLSDIDLKALERLIANSVAEVRRRYPPSDDAPRAPKAARR